MSHSGAVESQPKKTVGWLPGRGSLRKRGKEWEIIIVERNSETFVSDVPCDAIVSVCDGVLV